MDKQLETVFHVTVLSNFARAYDKYSRSYCKELIPESSFPDHFFVLSETELHIGIEKAQRLLERLALPGDRLLILVAELPSVVLQANLRTGKGRYLSSSSLPIAKLQMLDVDGRRQAIIPEEAYAASLAVTSPLLHAYAEIKPRSLSLLPVARACQAACKFCFSESSASLEQVPNRWDPALVEALCVRARAAGAGRFVITGGGEPGLVKHADLLAMIHLGRQYFDKVVMISNGYHLAHLQSEERRRRLVEYAEAGLGVLSISRHSDDPATNREIMGLDTGTECILASFRESGHQFGRLKLRLVCVLQRGGIQDDASLERYLDWAADWAVQQLCFKELYVSTTTESAYHDKAENRWSYAHQIPLDLVTARMARQAFAVAERLPWGAPIFEGNWNGQRMQVAAYTEPSLFWERHTGLARSWNIMADGNCLVSLEDPSSLISGAGRTRRIHIAVEG